MIQVAPPMQDEFIIFLYIYTDRMFPTRNQHIVRVPGCVQVYNLIAEAVHRLINR